MPTLWSSDVSKAILKQVKLVTKLVPETVDHYICFTSKFIWDHLFTYHLYHLFGIIYKSIFYILGITLKYCFISYISISGNFYLSENAPWVPGNPVVWDRFSLFSVITIIEIFSCIFILKCFSCSNSLVPLPFLFCHLIRRYQIGGNVKLWIAASNHDK